MTYFTEDVPATHGDRTKVNHTLVYAGEVWRIVGIGAERKGVTYCHLANLVRGRQQRNGWMPVQVGDWIDSAVVANAKPPTSKP